VKPAAPLGAHAAPLGMKFYTGRSFPRKYQGAILIARHGPWNRTKKYADVAVAHLDRGRVVYVEPFITGWVKDNEYLGRPVDIHQQPDGSILVSDDHNGAIYRVSYGR
jgi:glucose/arabinose dehydrogenase